MVLFCLWIHSDKMFSDFVDSLKKMVLTSFLVCLHSGEPWDCLWQWLSCLWQASTPCRAGSNTATQPGVSESEVRPGTWEFAFLTSFQVMLILLVQEPHFENHWLGSFHICADYLLIWIKMLFGEQKHPIIEHLSSASAVLGTLEGKGETRRWRKKKQAQFISKSPVAVQGWPMSACCRGQQEGAGTPTGQGRQSSCSEQLGSCPNCALNNVCHIALGKLWFFSYHNSVPSVPWLLTPNTLHP